MLEACPPIQAQPGIAQQKQPLHILKRIRPRLAHKQTRTEVPAPFFQQHRDRATPGVFGRKDMQSNRCSPPTPCLLSATPCIVGVTLHDAAGRAPADQFEEPHHGCWIPPAGRALSTSSAICSPTRGGIGPLARVFMQSLRGTVGSDMHPQGEDCSVLFADTTGRPLPPPFFSLVHLIRQCRLPPDTGP